MNPISDVQNFKNNLDKIFAMHTSDFIKALDDSHDWRLQVLKASGILRDAFNTGNSVLVAGNGGSATLAQHLSDEFVGKYNSDRKPFPVISLTSDTAVLTCIANDYGFDQVFKRQIQALGKQGDVFIGFSTSGNSMNIISAAEQAKSQGMITVGFSGEHGRLKDVVDHAVISPAKTTNRIQEMDLHAIHLICEAFEPSSY